MPRAILPPVRLTAVKFVPVHTEFLLLVCPFLAFRAVCHSDSNEPAASTGSARTKRCDEFLLTVDSAGWHAQAESAGMFGVRFTMPALRLGMPQASDFAIRYSSFAILPSPTLREYPKDGAPTEWRIQNSEF